VVSVAFTVTCSGDLAAGCEGHVSILSVSSAGPVGGTGLFDFFSASDDLACSSISVFF
jgi:hypothetical protein